MGEDGVGGAADDLAIYYELSPHTYFSELVRLLRELNDLGRADKREVRWIEEQHHILPLVVAQLYILEPLVPRLCLELRSRRRYGGGLFEWFVDTAAARMALLPTQRSAEKRQKSADHRSLD